MAHLRSPRAMSGSPPPQPMSKRDKRRATVLEKLTDMVDTFSKDQHQHYRAQLQAIQVDMTLILNADPYESAPLDDSPQATEEQIERLTQGNIPSGKAARDDFLAMAGRRYNEYAQRINHAMEQRDADLTALKNHYDSANAELERTTNYKIQVAQREHYELASTIRQRLINSVTKKRDKLLREKEQLDIADSNALFLNPAQYTLNIPNSPGGAHSNRKTRNMRHRVGEQEDAAVERGRKRKAPGDEDTAESPIPSFRQLVGDFAGASSPYHEARAKTLYSQHEAPAYSVERLFTDKELAQASTIAQYATHNFFAEQQLARDAQNPDPSNEHPASIPSVDGSADVTMTTASVVTEGEPAAISSHANGTPPPGQNQAAEMERTVSHHATRGAARANPLAFLSEAAAAVSEPAPANPFFPALVPITKTDKGAPTPPPMNSLDVDNDLSLMLADDAQDVGRKEISNGMNTEEGTDDNSLGAVRERFLEQATRDPMASAPFRLPLTDVGPAAIRGGVVRPAHYGFADPDSIASLRNGAVAPAPTSAAQYGSLVGALNGSLGGLPMSRATSMGGMSELGEPGGMAMRRTRSRLV